MLNLGNPKDAARFFGLRRAEVSRLVALCSPGKLPGMCAWVIMRRAYGTDESRPWLDVPEAEFCDMPAGLVDSMAAQGWSDERQRDEYYGSLRDFARKTAANGVVLFFGGSGKRKGEPEGSVRRLMLCAIEYGGRNDFYMAEVAVADGKQRLGDWVREVSKDASLTPPALRILP